MIPDTLVRLAALGVVAIVAIGAVLLLLRFGDRQAPPVGGIVEGYPPDHFANRELLSLSALADLAAAQGRLLAMQRALPPQSEEAVWLGTFISELRPLMNTAYRVAAA
ncbi:MAG: hypothetical protein WCI67_18380, partial [Chloroflexales bacterium]